MKTYSGFTQYTIHYTNKQQTSGALLAQFIFSSCIPPSIVIMFVYQCSTLSHLRASQAMTRTVQIPQTPLESKRNIEN